MMGPLSGRARRSMTDNVPHADRIHSALSSNRAAHSALVASWQRSSSLHRLDPSDHAPPRRLTETELRGARERMEPLVRAAQASLDRLYLAVGGVGCCVLLADRYGVPVERRGSLPTIARFVTGAFGREPSGARMPRARTGLAPA